MVVLEGRARGTGQTGRCESTIACAEIVDCFGLVYSSEMTDVVGYRTTAHLMMWNDDYYHLLEQQFGTDTMTKVAQSHRDAIDFVEKVHPADLMLAASVYTDAFSTEVSACLVCRL